MKKFLIGMGIILLILIFVLIFLRQRQILTPVGERNVVLGLTEELANRGISFSGLPIVQGDLIEASISGKRVLFSVSKDIASQVRALQLILPRLKMDTNVVEVDLRFNKVILR